MAVAATRLRMHRFEPHIFFHRCARISFVKHRFVRCISFRPSETTAVANSNDTSITVNENGHVLWQLRCAGRINKLQ